MLANIPNFLRTIIPTCLLLVPSLGHAQFSEPDFGNHPNPAEVRKVVEARRGKIQGCFKEHSQSMPERLDVQFTIWKDGGVNWASIDDSGIKDPSVTRCVRDVILLTNFPPPKVEIAKISYPFFFGDSKPPVSQGVVYNVIAGGTNDVQKCYENALTSNPGLAGKVTVQFVIATDGTVHSQKVVDTALNNAQAEDCILGVFSKLKFPRPKGGEVIVTFPFVFSVSDPSDVFKVIEKNSSALDLCFKTAQVDPAAFLGLRVRFEISEGGKPGPLSVSGQEPSDARLSQCVLDAIARMKFKSASHKVTMNFPFNFAEAMKSQKDKSLDDGASLKPDVTRKVVRQNREDIRGCHQKELARNPELEGRVATTFVVWHDGTVVFAAVTGSTLGNSTVEQCIVDELLTWTFPKPKGMAIINYPFELSK